MSLLVLILCFQFFSFVTSHQSLNTVEYDQKASDFLQLYMDPSYAPCDNFYDRVCRKLWTEEKPPIEKVRNIVLRAIDDLDYSEATEPAKATKVFYERCKDLEAKETNESIQSIVNDRLRSFEAKYQGQNRKPNVWRFLGFVLRELGFEVGFTSGADDPILLPLGAINVSPDLYTIPALLYASTLFPSALINEASARLQKFVENYQMSDAIPKVLLSSKLQDEFPMVDWGEYFQEVLPAELMLRIASGRVRVSVVAPEGTKLLFTLLNAMGYENLKLMITDQRFRTVYKTSCNRAVTKYLAPAVAKLYFDSIGENLIEWRNEILTITRNVVTAFRAMMADANLDWIDKDEKEKIQAKADNVKFYPGIPEWIENATRIAKEIEEFTVDTEVTFFENSIRWKRAAWLKNLGAIMESREGVSVDRNAYYKPLRNEIELMLGYTIPPYFHPKYPLAVKYGIVGNVIAHELMHAFDSLSINIPPSTLSKKPWLNEKTLTEFEKKKYCLVRQYAFYCADRSNICLNDRTLMENMADLDGTKVALDALKIAMRNSGVDPSIPVLLNYTNEQLYFVAFARDYCTSASEYEKSFTYEGQTAQHSPRKIRVEAVITNVRSFAKAFQCVYGSNHTPLNVCTVWSDNTDE